MTPELFLGNTRLPLPDQDGITMQQTPLGAANRMLAGNLCVDLVVVKRSVSLHWSLLTKAERDTIVTAWTACLTAATVLVLPDGVTLVVLPGLNARSETIVYDAHDVPYYNLSLRFEEV